MSSVSRVLTVVTSVVALAGCGGDSAQAPRVPEELVSWRGTLAPVVLMTGTLQAVSSDEMKVPRTSQRRVTIQRLVDDGAEVREGDLLVEFDNTNFATELEEKRTAVIRAEQALAEAVAQAEAAMIEAQVAVRRAEIGLEKARLDATVPDGLRSDLEDQEARLAVERAKTALDKAEADLVAARSAKTSDVGIARENLASARSDLAEAEEGIERFRITAPRDGLAIVSSHPWEQRRYEVGDTLWAGLPVVELPHLEVMRVEAFLPDVDDGLVAEGDLARCILDAYPDRVHQGRVTGVSSAARALSRDSLRRFFEVAVELDASDPEIMRPGMSVRVEIPRPVFEDAVLVPRAALVLAGDHPKVRVAGGRLREVTLGPCTNHACVVTRGLEAGVALEAVR